MKVVITNQNSTVDGYVWTEDEFSDLDFTVPLYSDASYDNGCLKYVPCQSDDDPTIGHRVRSIFQFAEPEMIDGVWHWSVQDARPISGLQGLADWLDNKAEEQMKHAISRENEARVMRGATAAELRSAKRMAEKMSGRKLDMVDSTKDGARAGAEVQERIAAKLECEARQLSAWAEAVRAKEVK